MEINLEKIGLLKSESKVYQALLETKPSSVLKIASKTGLNRISVYKALDKLMKIGLVSSVINEKKNMFEASDPKNVKRLIDEKEKELKELKEQIPFLTKVFNSISEDIQTNIYKGSKSAKVLWEQILNDTKKGDEWLVIGAPKSAEILGGYFKEFNENRAKKGISMKIIYNENAKELINLRKKQDLTEVKIMPKEYITPASFEIINNNFLIVLYDPQILLFHIKNPQIANSFKSYFELLWRIAKKE